MLLDRFKASLLGCLHEYQSYLVDAGLDCPGEQQVSWENVCLDTKAGQPSMATNGAIG